MADVVTWQQYLVEMLEMQEFASLLGRPNICKALARPPQSVACNMSSREDTEDQQNVVTSASGSVAMECTSLSRMEAAVQGMLREVGEDPDREVHICSLLVLDITCCGC